MAHFIRAGILIGQRRARVRSRTWRHAVAVAVLTGVVAGGVLLAQQLVDRVVARVSGALVYLSDVRAAAGLGVIEAGPESQQVQQMVQRQLLLNEVSRFPPGEPSASDVAAEVARLRGRVGDYAAFLAAHGLTDGQVGAMARDSLRIQGYLAQRFGSAALVSDDLAQEYYNAHPAEFTRDGVRQPFQAALPAARERASVERRRDAVTQWLRDLAARADVTIPK
jgi:hypothetical protein